MPDLYAPFGKRATDLVVGAVLLVVLAPLIVLLALLVLLVDRQAPLFTQRRLGRHGSAFTMLKLRTMRDGARPTPLGRMLRRTSLDELPSLVNVVHGSMGLVGPRPLLWSDRTAILQRCPQRLAVRPGLTGPVQTTGRNALDWQDRFALDRDYVARLSLASDLRLLWRTPGAVIAHATLASDRFLVGAPLQPARARYRR